MFAPAINNSSASSCFNFGCAWRGVWKNKTTTKLLDQSNEITLQLSKSWQQAGKKQDFPISGCFAQWDICTKKESWFGSSASKTQVDNWMNCLWSEQKNVPLWAISRSRRRGTHGKRDQRSNKFSSSCRHHTHTYYCQVLNGLENPIKSRWSSLTHTPAIDVTFSLSYFYRGGVTHNSQLPPCNLMVPPFNQLFLLP